MKKNKHAKCFFLKLWRKKMSRLFPCSSCTSLRYELKEVLRPPIPLFSAQPLHSNTCSCVWSWYVTINSGVPPGPILCWWPSLFPDTHNFFNCSSRFNKNNSIIYYNKVDSFQYGGTISNFQYTVKIKQALKSSITYIPGNVCLIYGNNSVLLFIYYFILFIGFSY